MHDATSTTPHARLAPPHGASATVSREVVVQLGWGRAILMQLAHPSIAAALAEHSDFRAAPGGHWTRLRRTTGAMIDLCFGTDAEVGAAAARINAIHDRVHGEVPQRGTRYSAHDPALIAWVHATVIESSLVAFEQFVRPLADAERDAYCEEASAMGPLLGVERDALPRSAAALARYTGERLRSGELAVDDTARAIALGVLDPPAAWYTRPAIAAMRLVTAALLPPELRRGFDLRWSTRHALAFAALRPIVRGARLAAPRRLRWWPEARPFWLGLFERLERAEGGQ